jgi:hypothetical protein
MKYISKFFSNRKRNIALIVIAVLVITQMALGLLSDFLVSKLYDQNEAVRWSEEKRSGQVSIFFTQDQMVEVDGIKRLEYQLKKKMVDAGITPLEDDKESGKTTIVDTIELGKKTDAVSSERQETDLSGVYASCFSAQGVSTLVFETKVAQDITTIGVDGDFFLFHPLELVSGSYFYPEDLMKDRIVIDEQLAWDLFGSNDIVGQCVQIENVNHYIAGVVKRSSGRINEAAGLSKSIVYMSYDSLSKYGRILSGRNESAEISEDGVKAAKGGINCYEVVMPNPVDGLAAKLVRESSGMDEKYITVVDNTERFSGFSLWDVIRKLGIRSMWDKPVFYPYWENVARAWEDILARIFLLRVLCIIAASIIFAVIVVIAYRDRTWTVSDIVKFLSDKKYDFEAERQLKKKAK